MLRLLIASSGKLSTGFGRVVRCLSDQLCESFEVHVLAHDVHEATSGLKWTLHPGSEHDVFAHRRIVDMVDSLRPDVLMIVNDYWFVPAYLESIARARQRPAVVVYTPIDARIADREALDVLGRVDGVAVYTEFARRVVTEAYSGGLPPSLRRLRTIPHGSMSSWFRPLGGRPLSPDRVADRQRARRMLLGDSDPRVDGFWVLSANRNSRRKRLDIAVEGFARFARDKPENVRMYLHAGRRDTGPNLERIASNLGLGDRLIWSADGDQHPEVSLATMNLIYNACEIGLNTSIGEGWGLVAFEHAATGGAQVLPRHSAMVELWEGSAEFVQPVDTVEFGPGLKGELVCAEDVAAALQRLYDSPRLLDTLSRAAHDNAVSPARSWRNIGAQWRDFLHEAWGACDGRRRAIMPMTV